MIHQLSLDAASTKDLIACLASIQADQAQRERPQLVRGIIGGGTYTLHIDDNDNALARLCCEAAQTDTMTAVRYSPAWAGR